MCTLSQDPLREFLQIYERNMTTVAFHSHFFPHQSFINHSDGRVWSLSLAHSWPWTHRIHIPLHWFQGTSCCLSHHLTSQRIQSLTHAEPCGGGRRSHSTTLFRKPHWCCCVLFSLKNRRSACGSLKEGQRGDWEVGPQGAWPWC